MGEVGSDFYGTTRGAAIMNQDACGLLYSLSLWKSIRPLFAVAALATIGVASAPQVSLADEGGVSFWLPGMFGSLAACRNSRAGHSPRSTTMPM